MHIDYSHIEDLHPRGRSSAEFGLVLLITVTFYNITMSISKTSKSFVKNKKMQHVSSFLPFKFGNKGLNITKKIQKKVVIIFNVYSIFNFLFNFNS